MTINKANTFNSSNLHFSEADSTPRDRNDTTLAGSGCSEGLRSNGSPDTAYLGDEGVEWFDARDGHRLSLTALEWVIPTPLQLVRINMADLAGATAELAAQIRDYLAYRLRVAEAGGVQREYTSVRDLLRETSAVCSGPTDAFTKDMVLTFRAKVRRSAPSNWMHLRKTLERIDEMRIGILAPDLRNKVKELPPRFPRGPSPVRLRDPRRSSLTDAELKEAVQKLWSASARGIMSEADQLLCLLIMVLGLRISQCSVAKVGDLGALDAEGRRVLKVSRMKLKSGIPRRVMLDFTLEPELAVLVVEQVVRARSVARRLGINEDEAALFPHSRASSREVPPGWEGHSSHGALNARFRYGMAALQLVSSRTGEIQNFTPIRGRRTLASSAKRAGFSNAQIAPMIQHKSPNTVRSYAEPTREVAAKAAGALTLEFAAIASMFARHASFDARDIA